MGKLFYIMGKSSTGKDTLYEALRNDPSLPLRQLVMYTTRPIRADETDGKEYVFVDEAAADALLRAGKVIEMRAYETVHGIWRYFTVDDARTDLAHFSYLAIGTLESYAKLKAYYGADRVVPIYLEVSDENRLRRALERECKSQNRKFEEMCRRFLADQADFSEEKLQAAGIGRRFANDGDCASCVREVARFIRAQM